MDSINLSTELSWFKKHETLILGVGVLLVVLILGNKYVNYDAARTETKAKDAEQVLQLAKQHDDDLKSFMQTQTDQYRQLVTQLQAQNAELVSSIQSRNQALQKQQQQDTKLPLPDLGKRWQQILNLPDGGVQTSGNGLLVNPESATTTVVALEEVPVLRTDLAEGKKLVSNQASQISSLTALNSGYLSQIDGLNGTITKQDEACKAEIKAEQAKTRKAFVRGFKWGAVIGFVGGIFTGHRIP